MEFHLSISTIIATTFYVLVLIFFIIILQILNKNIAKKRKCRKPPEAKGAWPVIGHLHLLGGSKLPHIVLSDMAEKYGPIFTIKLGVHQALVVSNGEMAKEIFTTHDKVFATRPKSEAGKVMSYNSALFGVAPYGVYWRQMRKIMTMEVLSQQRVESLGDIRVSELKASVKDIYDGWLKKNKDGEISNMVKVEMDKWFGNLILNIIIRVLSGNRFSANEEGCQLQIVVRKYFELFGAFVVSDFIPYLRFLDVGGHLKAMKKTWKDLDNIIETWLNEHKTKGSSLHGGSQEDFMNVLINILECACEEDFPDFDHDTIIKSTCLQLLLAGSDTTSGSLTWVLSLLLNNPKSLEIAQAEIDEHVGKERLVEESDMKNLVYLDAIIKETFRLYPPGPLAVPHESMEDCIVGGYNIPKGTRLLVNIWKMHHDPNIWLDPHEFRPERFLSGQKDIDMKGNQFEFIPFGSGRRMCPGAPFALQALRITLATLIQQFMMKRPLDEPIDMTESFGITSGKKETLEVLLAPRLSPHVYYDES